MSTLHDQEAFLLCQSLSARCKEKDLLGEFYLQHSLTHRFRYGGSLSRDKQERSLLRGRVTAPGRGEAVFTCSSLKKGAPHAALEEACAAAAEGSLPETEGPCEALPGGGSKVGILDARYSSLDDSQREQALLSHLEPLQTLSDLSVAQLLYADRLETRTFVSTAGVERQERSSLFELACRIQLTSGQAYAQNFAGRHFSDVSTIPLTHALAERAQAAGSPADLPDGPTPLVLETPALAAILAALAPAFRYDGFLRGLQGQKVASRRVHLMDDAMLQGGLRTWSFDDRGVPPKAITLIREGVLDTGYLDLEAARAEQLRPSGHERDSALQSGNLVLMSGNRSRTQMLSEIPQSVSLRHLTAQINAQGTLRARGRGLLLSKGQTSGDLGWIGFSMPVLEFLGRIREVASNHDRCNWVDCATAWAEDIRLKSVAPVKGPSAPSLLGWKDV